MFFEIVIERLLLLKHVNGTYLKVKFSVIVPQLGVISRQNFTIENGIVIAYFCACDGPTDFHGLVRLQQ
jgi:hypothetical protein